ncbi:hypothetical protein [Nostoc sp. PCC 9305]|uniref:hypothetical protein n=1 Tax=Nostoc sp. PCC 9305 TaxID=296636 RepID=UPI0039C5D3DB
MTTAQQAENKGQQTRTVAELVDYIQALNIEIQELYCIGYSQSRKRQTCCHNEKASN